MGVTVCGIEVCQKVVAEGFAYCQVHLTGDVFHRCEHCGMELVVGDLVMTNTFMGMPLANYHPHCWDLRA